MSISHSESLTETINQTANITFPKNSTVKKQITANNKKLAANYSKEYNHNEDVIQLSLKPSSINKSTYGQSTNERLLSCRICGKSFKFISSLAVHENNHSRNSSVVVRPFKCSVCYRAFAKKSTYYGHWKLHTSNKPHVCSVCRKTFFYKSYLDVHYRTHSGEKPYSCDICHSSFTQNFNLQIHYRTHTGEKPFVCDVCEKSFSDMANMLRHYRTHTGERPFTCEVCGKSFSQLISLKDHSTVHTGIRPFECGLCAKSFIRAHHLKKHFQRVHSKCF